MLALGLDLALREGRQGCHLSDGGYGKRKPACGRPARRPAFWLPVCWLSLHACRLASDRPEKERRKALS
eukprot:365381-Chlamydomonas_euryale.AAC.17